MDRKIDIKNARFELVNSTLKGCKEVEVIFSYNGKGHKYFIFIEEDKSVNYINEAKKQFEQDVKSGKVLKSIKPSAVNHRPWLIAGASILGVASLTLAGLFTWKMVTNQDTPAPTPTETECIVTFESNGADQHIDTMKVKPGTIISAPTPEKTDYTFGGWYEKSDLSGDPFNFDTAINKDYTFYAKWDGGPEPSDFATIIFDAGEGNKIEGSQKQTYKYYVEKGLTFGEIWKEIKYKGASKKQEDFLYWSLDDSQISKDYVINDDIDLVATYKPVYDDCLTVTIRSDNTSITFNPMRYNEVSYSLNHSSWQTPTSPTVTLNAGQQLHYKRTRYDNNTENTLYIAGPCSISGPVKWEYGGNTNVPQYAFLSFATTSTDYKSNFISAYNLDFGDIVLSNFCCNSMFEDCTDLVEAPVELPTQTLSSGCYSYMFNGCLSLKSAPEIKATSLTDWCFANMFEGCASLKISEGGSGTKIFTCLDLTGLEDPTLDMFTGTAGSFKGTPTPNNTYYYY